MLIRLISWKEDLARERAQPLVAAGFEVDASPLNSSGLVGHLRELAPDVVLIDLDRMPSHGSAVAGAMRRSKSICRLPIVFAGGVKEKVDAIRSAYPDAAFAAWERVAEVLAHAAAHPPARPVRPAPYMERYAGTPLGKKLGLKAGLAVALVGAPEGFEEALGELPEGATLASRMTRQTALSLWFVHSRRELDATADALGTRLADGAAAWVVYPKRAGRYKVDFTQDDVRNTLLEVGLVDYKICSIDADWSGLKFTRKKAEARAVRR